MAPQRQMMLSREENLDATTPTRSTFTMSMSPMSAGRVKNRFFNAAVMQHGFVDADMHERDIKSHPPFVSVIIRRLLSRAENI